MRAYRAAWIAGCVAVAVVGLTVTISAVAVSEPALAVVLLALALCAVRVHAMLRARGATAPVELRIIGGIALGGLAVFGLLELFGPVSLALLAVAVATAVPMLLRRQDHGPAGRSHGTRPDCTHPRDAVKTNKLNTDKLNTDELCTAWQLSHTSLASSTADAEQHFHLARIRQHYLDALEERDPTGVARWLASSPGPDSDPRPYLTRPSGRRSSGQ